ncbi:MAG: C69 family dipeptidase [Firmicutes bacterium]|nr:C69 family dipeptidase [Bacillota bacterium]
MYKAKALWAWMLAILVLVVSAPVVHACTGFMVGKDASVDGSTMITIQQDTTSYDFDLVYVPAKDHPPGTIKKLVDYPQWLRNFDLHGNPIDAETQYTGVEIPEVPHTYAYMRSLFGVMNEHQVSMGMYTIYPRPELRQGEDGVADGKLKMTTLSFVAMERAKTAREAIKVITELAEKYGFGSEYSAGKNLIIADPNEIWQLHMVQVGPWEPDSGEPGAVWAAQRVPDDHVAVGCNGFVITELDLDNPDYFMASSNVKTLAIKNGWWDPDSGKPFNFAQAYKGTVEGLGTLQRHWRGYSLIAPHVKLPRGEEALAYKGPEGEYYQYPFSVKAEKKISVADLNVFVRDVYEGTEYDLTRGPLAGPFGTWHRTQGSSFRVGDERVQEARGIQADSSQFTEICQMRGWLPNEIGGIVWWAPGPPKAAVRVPFYIGITELSKEYSEGNNHMRFKYGFEWGKTAGWAAVFVNTFGDVMYNYIIKDVVEFQNKIEGQTFSLVPAIDKVALSLYESDPVAARKFLTQWSNQFAEAAVKQHWDFAGHLIWKYHNRLIWEPTIAQSPKMQDADWWIQKALEWQKQVRQQ